MIEPTIEPNNILEEHSHSIKKIEETKQIIFNHVIKKQKNTGIPTKKYKKNKKRVVSEKWNLPIEYLTFEKQWEMIQNVQDSYLNNTNTNFVGESKILIKEIERKIYGYKQQDIEKQLFEPHIFLSLQDILYRMIECKMKCYYCFCEMYLLYEIVRESKQWSVDRLDNNKGHNKNNYVLACLECNLKRRCRTADKFLFTKQLNIVKKG
jgi:hypothetical protein